MQEIKMTFNRRSKFALGIAALVLPSALVVGYLKAKPLAHKWRVNIAIPAQINLPIGSPFPGLVAYTADYGNCNPDQGCQSPGLQRVLAMRADGTSVEQFWAIDNGQKWERQRIINDRNATRTFVAPGTGLKTTYYIPPERLREGRMNPAKGCTENMAGAFPFANLTQFVGFETIVATDAKVSYRAAKFHSDTPTASADSWYAPDLGCLELRSEFNWKEKNQDGTLKYYQRTTHIVRSVTLAAPPESLFSTAEFQEAKPSDAASALFFAETKINGVAEAEAQRRWSSLPDTRRAGMTAEDQRYTENRQRGGLN